MTWSKLTNNWFCFVNKAWNLYLCDRKKSYLFNLVFVPQYEKPKVLSYKHINHRYLFFSVIVHQWHSIVNIELHICDKRKKIKTFFILYSKLILCCAEKKIVDLTNFDLSFMILVFRWLRKFISAFVWLFMVSLLIKTVQWLFAGVCASMLNLVI